MTYGEQVLSRLNIPGVLLMALGAVLVYASAPLTRRLFDAAKQEKMNLVFKGVGCRMCGLPDRRIAAAGSDWIKERKAWKRK